MTSPESPATELPATEGTEQHPVRFHFTNTYARLPERFYARVNPTPVAAPRLIKVNAELARSLGLDPVALESAEGVEILAGNRVAEGSEPMALAYAGHQFGNFVPQLGDGRANLLGEVMGYDIQLKGSGQTPFSRRGDGRAALGPVLREYIVSEAMAALGVPTTRALAAVTTGQPVYRETILPGGVLTRVAASHLRVGTFQYFTMRGDTEATRILADYAIARHYPEAAQAKRPYSALLDAVISRQAHLVAQWMLLGFVHGVMNTDNMSISGETIDYGPCAFMEAYHPDTVFSSIDAQGRYAYGNQPLAASWNLSRLAEALLPLLEEEVGEEEDVLITAQKALAAFGPQFEAARRAGLRRKLGLFTEQPRRWAAGSGPARLHGRQWRGLHLDLPPAVRCRSQLPKPTRAYGRCSPIPEPMTRGLLDGAGAWKRMAPRQRQERAAQMRSVNPAFIPRNHMVEAAIQAAVTRQDFQPFESLLEVVSRPYEDRPDREQYATPARPEERVTATFCGT